MTSTNTSANISADTSSVVSPEKETVRWTEYISGQTAPSHIISVHSPLKVSSFGPVRRIQCFQACLRSQNWWSWSLCSRAGDCVVISIGWEEVGGGEGRRVGGEEVCIGIDSCYRCLVHLKLFTHFVWSVLRCVCFWSWSSWKNLIALWFWSCCRKVSQPECSYVLILFSK